VKEFAVCKNDAGQRLDRFLTKQGLPISAIMKALRKKDLKVNGIREKADYKLVEGDIIRVYAKDELFDSRNAIRKYEGVSANINIVYEDDNIILIDKPVGMLCHCDKNETVDTLINRVKAYEHKKIVNCQPSTVNWYEPSLCNRIDRNTAGIVIAAKNAEALRVMNEKIKLRQIKKLYLCILTGVPEKKSASLTAYLQKDESKNQVTVSNKKTELNKTIITKYRILNERKGLALAEIDLITGRTHQIRAHMASIGCPLLGDGKYGRNRVNKQYGFDKQALCSYKLIFEFENAGHDDLCTPQKTCLDYLSGRSFEVKNVWFLEEYYKI
jgi:23S rRNA pseudouridine955/2504/2580 synthase